MFGIVPGCPTLPIAVNFTAQSLTVGSPTLGTPTATQISTGSTTYYTSGNFTVPEYGHFTADVKGPGGGASWADGYRLFRYGVDGDEYSVYPFTIPTYYQLTVHVGGDLMGGSHYYYGPGEWNTGQIEVFFIYNGGPPSHWLDAGSYWYRTFTYNETPYGGDAVPAWGETDSIKFGRTSSSTVEFTWTGFAGSPGTAASSFASATPLIANPGGGAASNGNGTDGTASGGSTNTTGGGALGGSAAGGYTGGKGGRAQRTWARGDVGAPVPGTVLAVVVGGGGNGLALGGNGSVAFSWGA